MGRISLSTRRLILHKWFSEKLSFRELAKSVNCSKSAVFKIVKKFGETCSLEDQPKSGRKKGASDQKKELAAVRLLKSHKPCSVREIAKKLDISVGTVQNIKKRNNIKTYKKQRAPKRTDSQKTSSKIRSRNLYDVLLQKPNRCILMDDETYVKLDTSTLPGPQFFNAEQMTDVPDDVRYIRTEKFGKKVLVWQAICSCGLKSSSYFTTGTINGENYRQECIKKRLLPIYRKHTDPPLFWPDLASAHYASATLEMLRKEKVDFVEKYQNPPNCPELRPIERYWAIIKRHLKKDGREASSVDCFKKIWSAAQRKVTEKVVQNLMGGIKRKVRAFFRNEK